MPYIKEELRKEVEDWGELSHLIEFLKKKTKKGTENSGVVTYVIYKIVKEVFGEGNFETLSNALKVLDSSYEEFVENILKPYERVAKERNGDV